MVIDHSSGGVIPINPVTSTSINATEVMGTTGNHVGVSTNPAIARKISITETPSNVNAVGGFQTPTVMNHLKA